SYFFQSIAMPDAGKGYVIGRKIAVGFDYTFYLNGRPGRLGNYVVDSYVFPQCPTAEDFEILLENPAAGSNHFIPTDPAPRNGNEEMRSISVGHQPDLFEEERPFRAVSRPETDRRTIDLLFGVIASRKVNKPLLVKGGSQDAPRLMAGLAMMMPQKHIQDITFVTNHGEQGMRGGINIYFISDSYRYEIFPNQWTILDLNNAGTLDTPEKAMFAPMVERYLRDDQLKNVRRLVAWCLSAAYEASKSAPQETQKAMYAYTNDYDAFNVGQLATDAKLRELLSAHLQKNPEEKRKLEKTLQDMIDRIDLQDIKAPQDLRSWIDLIRKIRPIDMQGIADRNKAKINDIIFRDAETFESFYLAFSGDWKEIVKDFIDADKFVKKSYYLSDLRSNEWEKLYPYFLKEIEKDKATLVWRMFEDGVTPEAKQRILDKEIPDKRKQSAVVLRILKSSPGKHEEELIGLLTRELRMCPADYFSELPEHIADDKYAPLYVLQLEMSATGTVDGIRAFHKNLVEFVDKSPVKAWLPGRNSEEALKRMLASLKTNLRNNAITKSEAKNICEELLEKRGLPESVRLTCDALFKVLSGARDYNRSDRRAMQALWSTAKGIGDREYLRMLAPDYLKSMENKEDCNRMIQGSADYPEGLVAYIVDNGLLSEEEILSLGAKSQSYRLFYVLGLMQKRSGRPQEEYEFLTEKAGLKDEEAMDFLRLHAETSYRKILKSRQPSIWSRIVNGVKALFSKKDDGAGDTPDSGPDKERQSGCPRPKSYPPNHVNSSNTPTTPSRRRRL
ncbi:MAG: hypothetical protein K2J58_07395, partial [Muribaculaceae bacterium]|nr:hypothetical protein [Muribaculaceae bacterium]